MVDLLYIPATRVENAVELRRLRAALDESSLEEVIKQRVDAFLAWKEVDDPVLRRFRRNASLVFSRTEIEIGIRNEILRLLPYLNNLDVES